MQVSFARSREAIILAGGKGTRLRSVVADRPKVLAPVAGIPFLEIILRQLARNGFGHVVLSVGYMAEHVIQAVGERFSGLDISYVREEEPLGTGGGVKLALTACRQDHVFVMNGDTFLDLNFAQVEEAWRVHKDLLLVGRQVDDTARYGRLQIDGARVTGFMEKGAAGPGIINTGYYVLPPSALDHFPADTAFSLEVDFLQPRVAERPCSLFVTSALFIDIGIPEDYTRAQILFNPPRF